MDLDAKVCLCFHVTRRKLANFIRVERPRVASQLSQCGGAGTGCGWCVPFLQQLFASTRAGPADLDSLTAEEYARRRAEHIRAGKGTPPPGGSALPEPGSGERSG
jgi:NAD(P)H-nitrite reductase large subunit